MISSRSFMVLGLVFETSIYFELTFVEDCGPASFFCKWLSSLPDTTY